MNLMAGAGDLWKNAANAPSFPLPRSKKKKYVAEQLLCVLKSPSLAIIIVTGLVKFAQTGYFPPSSHTSSCTSLEGIPIFARVSRSLRNPRHWLFPCATLAHFLTQR